LLELAQARNAPGLLLYPLHRRHQNRHQERNDGDYYQKLYQSKCFSFERDGSPFFQEVFPN